MWLLDSVQVASKQARVSSFYRIGCQFTANQELLLRNPHVTLHKSSGLYFVSDQDFKAASQLFFLENCMVSETNMMYNRKLRYLPFINPWTNFDWSKQDCKLNRREIVSAVLRKLSCQIWELTGKTCICQHHSHADRHYSDVILSAMAS